MTQHGNNLVCAYSEQTITLFPVMTRLLPSTVRTGKMRGYEHHVAASLSTVASAVQEVTTHYLRWNMHHHNRENGAC
ncbi:MAG: hypothetical protein WB781_24510 [Candidatus Sulfotelmatobacter sp.]